MFKRLALAVLVITLSTMLVGCFDIEEKVSILPDGKADMRLTIRMSLPAGKDEQKTTPLSDLDEVGKGVAGVTVSGLSTRTQFGQTVLGLKMSADSFRDLRRAYATMPKKNSSVPSKEKTGKEIEQVFSEEGFYKIKRKGSTLVITRTLGQKKKASKKKKDAEAEMMMALMGSMMMRFDLTLPSKVLSSNAESMDNNTLHWVIPLAYLSDHRVELQATIESTPELRDALLK